jgi:hypothetical protein
MQLPSVARSVLPLAVATLFATQLGAQGHDHPAAPAAPSADAQRAFTLIKTLSGAWQGLVVEPTTNTKVNADVTLRVTSRGNSAVHEIKLAEATDNPIKNDHPVTMMYIDGANLLLTHYCDAGNRPRMTARVSADARQIDFDFLDLTGPTTYGHMQHARFTLIDPTHHLEDWTYEAPDGKTVTAHFDLKRVSDVATVSAK